MKRPVLAVLVVALGLLAPATATTLPARAATGSSAGAVAAPVASGRVVSLPAAAKVDRCATRSKKVSRLKRRYKTAKTRRGKARTLRLLNAARRSLKRCRAHKPAPNTTPGPGTNPAPAPATPPGGSATPLPPVTEQPPAPPVEGVRLTVNDGLGGTFSSSTTFTIAVTGLPTPPDGTSYRLAIRSPEKGNPRDWRACQQPADSDPFTATGAAVTLAPTTFSRWCVGVGKVFVWAGGPEDGYSTALPKIASLDINVVD
jgi:hypothetical protein